MVCFGWGRVRAVAGDLRQRDASARLVLVPDVGKEAEAQTIAREVAAQFVSMPSDAPPNFDANDYAAAHGHDALDVLLSRATEPANPSLSLGSATSNEINNLERHLRAYGTTFL